MENTAEWLIRTAQNQIIGPLSRAELCTRIQSGKLNLQDEICPANGYWIFLHEHSEVLRLLGLTMKPGVDHDEVTQTQTQTETQTETATIIPSAREGGQTPQFEVRGHSLETVSIWRAVAWVLGFGVLASMYFVFRLTQA